MGIIGQEGGTMPTRTLLPNLLLGVIGLVVLAWLVLWRRDVDQASRQGSHWRQRLLTAGLLLLAVLGFTPPTSARGKEPKTARAGSVLSSPEWKHITAIRKEAEAIATGKRGPHPFDRAGKKRVLTDLKAAQALADDLAKAGAINVSAAGLLKLDLERLSNGVARKRPTEMRRATCYRPMMRLPRRDSYNRLKARLPLLEKLARKRRVQRAVLDKVLAAIEADLKVVGSGKSIRRLGPNERKKAPRVVRRARASLSKIKRLAR